MHLQPAGVRVWTTVRVVVVACGLLGLRQACATRHPHCQMHECCLLPPMFEVAVECH